MVGRKGALLRVAAATAGLAAIAIPLSNLPKDAPPLGTQVGTNWLTPLGPAQVVVPPSPPPSPRSTTVGRSLPSVSTGGTSTSLRSLLSSAPVSAGLGLYPSRPTTGGRSTAAGAAPTQGSTPAATKHVVTTKRTTPAGGSRTASTPKTTLGLSASTIGRTSASSVGSGLTFTAISKAASKASLTSYASDPYVNDKTSGSAKVSLAVSPQTSGEHAAAQTAAIEAAKAKLDAPVSVAVTRPETTPTPVALAKAAEQAKLDALHPAVETRTPAAATATVRAESRPAAAASVRVATTPAAAESKKPVVLEPTPAQRASVEKPLPSGGSDSANNKRFAKILALKLGADKSGVSSGKK